MATIHLCTIFVGSVGFLQGKVSHILFRIEFSSQTAMDNVSVNFVFLFFYQLIFIDFRNNFLNIFSIQVNKTVLNILLAQTRINYLKRAQQALTVSKFLVLSLVSDFVRNHQELCRSNQIHYYYCDTVNQAKFLHVLSPVQLVRVLGN